MARKRKKPTRKERKQQRRAAMAHKRKERGPRSRRATSTPRQDDLFEDMLPLFSQIGGPAALSVSGAEQLVISLMDSYSLADEPELKEILVDPMLCLRTFSEVVRELDIEPESLDELPDEEREDTQMAIREEIAQRLLTDELRQDIVNGLNNLRLRLKQSGQRKEAARAALLQSFLTSASPVESGGDVDGGMLPMLGLVQAIFMRSLMIGFELMEAAMEVEEAIGLDKGEASLPEAVAQSSSVPQKVESLLKKTPGLLEYAEKQTDKIWAEGLEAVLAGDLHLGLYSPEELEPALDIFTATFGLDLAEEMATQDHLQLKVSEGDLKDLLRQLDDYLTELITPERLDRLRARLDTVLKDPAYKKWSGFLYMLVEYMADENAVEIEKRFLVQALLGEMEVVAAEFEEAGE